MDQFSTSTKSELSRSCATPNKLRLTSGERVRTHEIRREPPPPPPSPIMIGKLLSLELTLAAYGIEPNTATRRRLGGVR